MCVIVCMDRNHCSSQDQLQQLRQAVSHISLLHSYVARSALFLQYSALRGGAGRLLGSSAAGPTISQFTAVRYPNTASVLEVSSDAARRRGRACAPRATPRLAGNASCCWCCSGGTDCGFGVVGVACELQLPTASTANANSSCCLESAPATSTTSACGGATIEECQRADGSIDSGSACGWYAAAPRFIR
jgi:hypothetical protein